VFSGNLGKSELFERSVGAQEMKWKQNPFSLQGVLYQHPVEQSLRAAFRETIRHNSDAFKQHRSNVLERLEPQYQRILAASAKLVDFIKSEKRAHRFLSPDFTDKLIHQELMAEGLVLVEDYNEALKKRDIPETVRVLIKCVQEQFDASYERSSSQSIMRDLQLSWKTQDCTAFRNNFKRAVNKLDQVYLRIRDTRNQLFTGDIGELGMEVDIHTPATLIDEMVNWCVDEPVFDPLPT
jgi:hypothetical protein